MGSTLHIKLNNPVDYSFKDQTNLMTQVFQKIDDQILANLKMILLGFHEYVNVHVLFCYRHYKSNIVRALANVL